MLTRLEFFKVFYMLLALHAVMKKKLTSTVPGKNILVYNDFIRCCNSFLYMLANLTLS